MNEFKVYDASSIKDAENKLKQSKGSAEVLAGGTDLVTRLRGMVSPTDPSILVNLKTIQNMDYINLDASGNLKIGSLATLNDIAEDQTVKKHFPALAKAAGSVGGPELRNMGTIGGNICQYVRCWYYRAEFNVYDCLRKNNGAGQCYAKGGDDRYHSILGCPTKLSCFAVNPSDTAPVLIALGATIVTNKRTILAENLFSDTTEKTTILGDEEIITEIQIPKQEPSVKGYSVKTSFVKFAIRKSIDFAIVNCAVVLEKDSANKAYNPVIWLNGVYITPKQAKGAQTKIAGNELKDANAKTAGKAAFTTTQIQTLKYNKEKVWIMQSVIRKALVECGK